MGGLLIERAGLENCLRMLTVINTQYDNALIINFILNYL